MPIGAGLAPAGTSPAGFGVPESAQFTPDAPLPDTTTGLSLTGRLIDPETGDYVMGADGRLQGMGTVQQLVLLAMLNLDFSGLDEKGPGFDNKVRAVVQAGLSALVTSKQIQIRSITVSDPTRDSVLAAVSWVDLTNPGPPQTTDVPRP